MARPSESVALALDPDSALDSPDHIVSEPIDRHRVQRCALHDGGFAPGCIVDLPGVRRRTNRLDG
jgi:hypothetical protein